MASRNPLLLTAEDLYALPDDGLIHELVEGRLIAEPLPGARHGRVCVNVVLLLGSWARATSAGSVYTCDTGFVLARDPDTVRGPDVAFVLASHLSDSDPTGFHEIPPDLAVEVLSPSNRRRDMDVKVDNYLKAGGALVWLVDPAVQTLTVRTIDGSETLRATNTYVGTGILLGLQFAVSELFE